MEQAIDNYTKLDPRDYILDSGPLYHEFHFDSWLREPWNALSSLFFLVPVFFWLWKLRGQYRKYPMITLFLPFLFLNGVGSSIYHAFRSSDIALLLDWMPAFIMNLLLSWYLWNKVLRRPFISALMVLAFITSAFFAIYLLAPVLSGLAANIGYFMIGMSLLIPSGIYLFRTKFYKGHLLIMTFVFLGIALVFRSLDHPTPNPFPEILPQGTHFLWHITSALAVFSLGFYFKFIRDRELSMIDEKEMPEEYVFDTAKVRNEVY
jgi:hypothetical protein